MPGLNAILDLGTAVSSVAENLANGNYIRKGLEQHGTAIIDMNISQLYDQGVNSLGIDISSYRPYSPYTIMLKKEKGQPYDRVTLRDTGAFHSSFEMVLENFEFYFTATDYKTQELIHKYGENIFGLTEENKKIVAHDYVFPVVMDEVKKEIFG